MTVSTYLRSNLTNHRPTVLRGFRSDCLARLRDLFNATRGVPGSYWEVARTEVEAEMSRRVEVRCSL